MVVAWELEPGVDYLARNEQGLFNFWWAGCYQSEKFLPLAELITPDFLAKFSDIAATEPTHKECGIACVDVGGYGEPFSMDFLSFEPIQ